MEGFECIVLFADTNKLNGRSRDLAYGERRATASVAVHFGEHNARELKLFV